MTPDAIALRDVVLERLTALGVDVALALEQAKISRSRFTSSRAMLTTKEFFAFWRAVEDGAGSQDLGLRLGRDGIRGRLDVAAMAALQAPTLAEALAKVARFKRLCMTEEVRIDTNDEEASISFHWRHADEHAPKILVDSTFAHIVALIERGIGERWKPSRIELARRRANEAMLDRHFDCHVVFNAPLDRIVFPRSLLSRAFVKRSDDLYHALLPEIEQALQREHGSRRFPDDVRDVVRHFIAGDRPSVEKVAVAMQMSPRTLQRRLKDHETTYQRILDEERERIARRLLSDTDLDPGEIAFVLGFEELNSFSRAFHSRAGVTPIRWRSGRSAIVLSPLPAHGDAAVHVE